MEQKVAGLPDGTYALSVWTKGTAAGTLYAKNCGGGDKMVALSGGSTWARLSLAGIAVAGGSCQVGASTSGGTVTLDDFTLTRN